MIRAYVNRNDPRRGPIVVELWRNGQRLARSFCGTVIFEGQTRLVSTKGTGAGFQGYGGMVHTWAESDADAVSAMTGVTHTEGTS